jgi:predicted DsbA family dithiol-disulfide isomerase
MACLATPVAGSRWPGEARRLGVTGVPFAVFGGRLAIPGAASVDGYVNVIEQARSER